MQGLLENVKNSLKFIVFRKKFLFLNLFLSELQRVILTNLAKAKHIYLFNKQKKKIVLAWIRQNKK